MKKIDAVKIVPSIHDKQDKETSGKSPKEIIEYFCRKAKKIEKIAAVEDLSLR